MSKVGWILLVLVVLAMGSISCKSDVATVAPVTKSVAASPMETTDGALSGAGWSYGQTPQSYNTGKKQIPMSAEEANRIKIELEKEMEEASLAEIQAGE